MNEIQHLECILSIDDYYALFETTGWNEEYHFSKSDLEKAIKNRRYAISAYRYQQLIGFGRVIADGRKAARAMDIYLMGFSNLP
ncbi:MAG: hypothetical protein ABR936_00100 [Bacteroidota bacterium]|jgi:hypothetical protein